MEDLPHLNYTSDYDFTQNIIVQVVFGLCYVLVFIVGLFGNVLVCYVVIRNPQLRKSVTNLFIGNLAVSNALLFAVRSIYPAVHVYGILGFWRTWLQDAIIFHSSKCVRQQLDFNRNCGRPVSRNYLSI